MFTARDDAAHRPLHDYTATLCILLSTASMRFALLSILLAFAAANGAEALPACPMDACPTVVQPVCGSNNVTYLNACIFTYMQCHDEAPSTVTIDHGGECVSDEGPQTIPLVNMTASMTHCRTCRLNDSDTIEAPSKDPVPSPVPTITPSCEASCDDIVDPVCGSDGVIYDNECALRRQHCLHPDAPRETVVDRRECFRSFRPRCFKACADVYDPVCGSDGVTYGNPCAFENERCVWNATLTIVKGDACEVSI